MSRIGSALCVTTGMILRVALQVVPTVIPALSFKESDRNTVCVAAARFTNVKKTIFAKSAELHERNKHKRVDRITEQ